jgi:hypothetical protein
MRYLVLPAIGLNHELSFFPITNNPNIDLITNYLLRNYTSFYNYYYFSNVCWLDMYWNDYYFRASAKFERCRNNTPDCYSVVLDLI